MNYQLRIMFFVLFFGFTQMSFSQEVSWYSKDMGFTSSVHKKHAKQIVWSKSVVDYSTQETNVLENRFNLTDPIYGRVYLERSIRNTPIYSSASKKPLENSRNGYEMKLFIDDKDAGGSFGVFEEGYFNDEMGKTWTTWQFSPHMTPPNTDEEKTTAKAWEKAVRGLSVGEHKIRFDLWGISGTHRSSEPMASGTFTLVVSKGERVATTAKFPKQTYSGSEGTVLANQLKQAMVNGGKASVSEIKKIAITSDWVYNRYTDTKKEYRKISAAILFADKDNDGVCRFVTYNFISDKAGSVWKAPRFHSFCNGCAEGDVNCP
ncbi:MAG: hypothetical protein D8M58_04710 [Calditrichaeota bacterium]|nr:MAG: hypothetical protein DWQ03_02365 [Calditrichota bacterium]MBL1204673.1 hypothetical protein [Calditrichota bacterium]NOG44501.1 hypothetical protein [Calditrichota bacterium]